MNTDNDTPAADGNDPASTFANQRTAPAPPTTSELLRAFQPGAKAWLHRPGQYGRRSRYEVTVATVSECGRYACVTTASGLEKLVKVRELRVWP